MGTVSQIEEMYSVPESFLEIEVRNPQTHGKSIHLRIDRVADQIVRIPYRFWQEDVHGL